MVTDANLQAQIVLEVGDINSIVQSNIAAIWALYADKAYIAPRLQYLYAKRAALDVLWGFVREQVTTEAFGDVKINLSDKPKTILAMRAVTNMEITVLLDRQRANRVPAVGAITAKEPILPPSQRPAVPVPIDLDADDERYRGSPYFPLYSPVRPN